MTERKLNPEEKLEQMIQGNVSLQVAEIVAFLGGIGGTALIILRDASAAFATGPLALSVFLNILNRKKLDQLTRQQSLLDTTEVQRRLSSEIQGLQRTTPSDLSEIDPADSAQIQQALASLSDAVSALDIKTQDTASAADMSQFSEELVQVRNQQLGLSQAIEAINQQVQTLPVGGDSSKLESEISLLKERIEQAPAAEGSGPIDLEPIRGEFNGLLAPIQAQLQSVETRLAEQGGSAVDLEPVRSEFQQMMEPIRSQLGAIEERMAQPGSSEAQAGSSEQLQQVQQHVGGLSEKLDHVTAQLSAEIAGFQQAIDQAQARMQAMSQDVQAAKSAEAPQLSMDAIRQEMQAAVGPLHEQFAMLEQKINAMPSVDPNAMGDQAQQVAGLQQQLDAVNKHLNEFANEMGNLPSMVEEKINQKVANLQPAAPADTKQDKLSELDDILAGINFD